MQDIKKLVFILKWKKSVSLPMYKRTLIFASILITGLLASIVASMYMGSINATWKDVWLVLNGYVNTNIVTETIFELRVPRIIGSMCGGMLMALSGYLLQIVMRNALADPGILGLSKGATLAAIIMFIWFPTMAIGQTTLITFLGAFLTGMIILGITYQYIQSPFVVLIGIAINTILSALSNIIMSSVDIQIMVSVQSFLSGTFEAINDKKAIFLLVWSIICCLMIFLAIGRWINPMSMGYRTASHLGINTKAMYSIMVLLSIVAMAPVIALAGSISFVGLVSTFLAKNIIGYRGTELGLVSMLLGAIMTMWADTLGRTLFAPIMINAGVFIAIIGAIFFVVMTRYITKS